VAGLAGVTGGAVLAAGAFVAVASTVDKNVPAMKRLDDSFINAERHIPLVGNALANLDQHLPGVTHHTDEHSAAALAQSAAMASVGLTLTAFDDTLDKSETSMSNLTEAHKAEMAESVRHEKALTGAAQSIGLSEEGLVRAIGFAGQSNIATWAAEEAAATKFAAAVTQGENAASASFAKTIDAVGAFSASSLLSADKAAASSTRAADTIVADDTRVADAVQHVADLQEQYAAKATSDRQAYADKVTSADEAMTAADASYADTVDTTNQRIADADRKLAEDRISGAQSVADAEKRLEDDRVSGQQSVADLQQKLADDTERQALARNPAALARFNNTLQLRDARAAIAKAQDSASDKEKADVDAIAKAKAAALKTERTDQEAADKARSDGAKAVEKAEDGVTAARAAQNKLAAEANTIGVESLAQQTEMRKAIEAVGKAQTTSATQAVTSSVAATTAVKLTTEQVAEFYKTSIADSERFTDEIHSAIEKGYDPAFIARLMEEGPKEAQPVLALIAGQTDDTFRDMVNNGEKKLAQLKLYTADMNHAVEIAANTSNATIRGDFDLAMKALAVLAANGGHMTVQALADALQTGPAIILRISGEYGGAMAAGINPLLAGIGAPTIDAASMAKYGADRSYFMATGGHVPGHGQGDTVPAMLTPGEYVISKPAVDRLGVDNLDQMHKVARRGYAAGGFVTAADVPPVPDFSAYGTALGYSATKADEFERAKVIDYLNGRAAAKGKGSGGSGYGFQALIDYLDNQGIPNQVTSTTGGGHAEGSRHYMGLAADFVSDDMDQIGRAFMGIQGSMYELIHNPGFSVKGGQQVDPGFWGSDTWGQHTDHVHAATYKDSAEGPGIPTAGGTASSGGKVYQGQVADWVAAGVALAGKPDSWDYPEVNIAMFESGGDPNAQNNWDSNAAAGHPSKGLMQMIDSTFQAYMVPGHGDIWNPIDNAASATGYIAADYGDPWHTPGELSIAKGGAYQGYELGGLVAGLSMGVMDKGGYLEPGWNLNYNGLGVREPVGAMAGGGGGQAAAAGGDIHVHFAINGLAVGTTKQFADMLAEPLRSVVVRRWRGNTGNFFDGR
jgi:hypothetical protein